MKKNEKDIVCVVLYVDNNLMIDDVEAINDAIIALKENRLVLKIVKGLQDYLSCEVKIFQLIKRAWLRQHHLIKNLIKEFGDHVKKHLES